MTSTELDTTPATSRPPRRPRSARLGRRFQRLLATTTVAGIGDGFTYAALPLLAAVVDPHPLAVSAVVAAQQIPYLFALLPAGVIADRVERARLMVVANLGRAAVLAAVALLVASRRVDITELILFAFGIGSCQVFYHAAAQALLPELVRSRALPRANGQLTAANTATEHLAGPTLGALAFSAIRSLPFFVDAAAVATSALPLVAIRSRRATEVGGSGGMWDGFKFLAGNRGLRNLAGLIVALAFGQGMVNGVLVLVATRDWHVPAAGYGAFVATAALGNVIAALNVQRTLRLLGTARTLILAATISGAGYLVMSRATNWPLAAGGFFIEGLAVASGAIAGTSLRQKLTPTELQGRVGAPWRGLVWSAVPIGALIGGVVAASTTLKTPLLVAGIAQIALGLVMAVPLLRSLRGVDQAAGAT